MFFEVQRREVALEVGPSFLTFTEANQFAKVDTSHLGTLKGGGLTKDQVKRAATNALFYGLHHRFAFVDDMDRQHLQRLVAGHLESGMGYVASIDDRCSCRKRHLFSIG